MPNCEAARSTVESKSAVWHDSFKCHTLDEALEEVWDVAADDFALWFWEGGGCQISVDALTVVAVWGAVRIVIKKSAKHYLNRVLEAATRQQKEAALSQARNQENNWGAIAALGGIVLGETINDFVGQEVEGWLRSAPQPVTNESNVLRFCSQSYR